MKKSKLRYIFLTVFLFLSLLLSSSVFADTVNSNGDVFQGVTCSSLENQLFSLSNEGFGPNPPGTPIGRLKETGTPISFITASDEKKYSLLISFDAYAHFGTNQGTFSSCTTTYGNSSSFPVPSDLYFTYSSINKTSYDNYFAVYTQNLPQSPYNYQQACGQGSSAVGTTSYNNCINCIQQNSAQDQSNGVYKYVYTDFGCVDTSTSGIIRFIYQLMVIIGAIISFISMLVGGYMFMTSGGDSDKVQKAKTVLTNAIIGLLVIIFAVVILGTIGTIFGISVISF